ncbi:uncharacterized protein LOC144172474 [Haemaphysalis longicornis]
MPKGIFSLVWISVAAAVQYAPTEHEFSGHREIQKYGDAWKLLGGATDLVLLRVSQHTWREDYWECLVSKFIGSGVSNGTYYRSLEYSVPRNKKEAPESREDHRARQLGRFLLKYEVFRQVEKFTEVNTTVLNDTKGKRIVLCSKMHTSIGCREYNYQGQGY